MDPQYDSNRSTDTSARQAGSFCCLAPADDQPLANPENILYRNLPFDFRPYAAGFERNFPKEMELLRKMRVHPESDPGIFWDPFGKREVKDDFSNIGEHCIAVAACASVLAGALERAEVFSAKDVNHVISRAIIHDAAKPYDIFLNQAVRENRISSQAALSEAIWEPVKAHLVATGIPAADAAQIVSDYGAETGGRPDCLKRFLLIGPDGLQGLVEGQLRSKVVHLVDDMICSANGQHWALTPLERISAAFAGKKAPWGWSAGFGVDAQHELVHVEKVVQPEAGVRSLGSYHGLMIWISNLICREIVLLTGNSSGGQTTPERFVKDLVNEQLIKMC